MAIETAFETLQRQLQRLREELDELRVNAEEFYPPPGGHGKKNGHKTPPAPPPVVALADKAADLEGEIEEALQSGRKALRAVSHPRNLVEAQIAAGNIQRHLNSVLRRFFIEAAAHEPLETLLQMGRELGDSWSKWTQLIHSILNDCRDRLMDALQALGECWQELVDKLAGNSVSVHTTNIGQQIAPREATAPTVQEFT